MVLTRLLYWIVFLFFITLIIRLVIDWIQVFARDWRPRGAALVVAEGVYSTTDPPLKALRRVLPPLRIGPVMLDLAFILLFLLCTILLGILG
jgi:YggT family protein